MARGDPPAKRIVRMSTGAKTVSVGGPATSAATRKTLARPKHFKPAKHSAALKKGH